MAIFFPAFRKSLTAKLVVTISLLVLCGSGLLWFSTLRAEKKQLMDNVLTFVRSFSELTKKSIHFDMLTNQREALQRSLEYIGNSESIRQMRIYDRRGMVVYASDKQAVGRVVPQESFACAGCHAADGSPPLPTLSHQQSWTIYRDDRENRVLALVEPIYNEPDCYTAACHAHRQEQKVLGVLVTDFSLHTIDARLAEQMFDSSIFMLVFVSVIALFLSLILWRYVLGPVTALAEGMKRVSSGELTHKLAIPSDDEIGRLARTFNTMTGELFIARQRMEKWTQTLEEEVEKKARQIKSTQDKLIQAEKLAALGRLTADIAHEIRNPLTALGGFGRRLQRTAHTDEQKKYTAIIVSEADRLEHILRDVLVYSRWARFHFEKMEVADAVVDSIALFAEICREHAIEIVTDFATRLPVLLEKDQVKQAVNNLISNAVDAMEQGGTLTIATALVGKNDIAYVALTVSDTGPGIPADKLDIVFEPFYSSKKIGQGTGLGLAITRKIVEEHGGFTAAENRPGGGLSVGLYFPYQSEEDNDRMPCWEFMQCGRDTDNSVKCPAFPHFGRVCWAVAGTLCQIKVQGTFAQKSNDCRQCRFYKSVIEAREEEQGGRL